MIESLEVKIKDEVDLFILEHRVNKFIEKNFLNNPSLIIIARELATNILKYGGEGHIRIDLTPEKIIILAEDEGRKQENVSKLNISSGLGLGLKIIENNTDEMEIKKNARGGTTVKAVINLIRKSEKDLRISVGIATRPKHLEDKNGDVVVFKRINGKYLLVVADVLGHGDKAYEVAERIKEYTMKVNNITTLYNFFIRLEMEIAGTRGSAVFSAVISSQKIEYFNIGNIRAWLASYKNVKYLSQVPGIVGRLPVNFKSFIESGGLYNSALVVCTDGITRRFTPESYSSLINECENVQQLAEKILAECGLPEDDATVVILKG
ncbi:ATP-binding region ATPase domain protein [Caldicellulosiruptor owensensis OL]|uniref:ATP-binding region ATPase domain protein n=1 Tax=Caldicellulosiruptor owensensis (strain ATCC 700167 / DSM 13100 / OL) TaxID=632518 RepID=E4Q3X2_CALOW|nr:SpoIIE family protein phosphatase [Caldicellulosiruptor owensensis]ADQ04007.1 ATP-binding region ATPase domain protein [Caldicellulosiruptor owensensis OL]